MKNINPQKSNSLTIDICKFLGAVYGRRDTYDAVESFWHRSVQYGVSEFYLLRRALFLHGVGLSARRAYGMAAYGKG